MSSKQDLYNEHALGSLMTGSSFPSGHQVIATLDTLGEFRGIMAHDILDHVMAEGTCKNMD
jgi:hypothetical protein